MILALAFASIDAPAAEGGALATAKHIRMAPSDDLEIRLLRKSVDHLGEDRHRCGDCGRTPLIGERIYVYVSDEIVCELCRAMRAEEPMASRLVRHDSGQNVRVRSRVA